MLPGAATGRSSTRGIQLGKILHGDRVLRTPATSVIHLLRAGSILVLVVRSRHRAYIIEGFNATLIKSFGNRLVLSKLIHDHLLVSLLSCKHI